MISIVGPNPSEVSHQNILDFMAIRKAEFVDRLGWDLVHTSQVEWDEYDLPNAQFIVAYEDGKCIGGARLMRTDSITPRRQGQDLSYMLADFLSGALPVDFDPAAMKAELHPSADLWEMTRFVGSPHITRVILARANEYLAEVGAESVLTLSPRLMPLALRRLGYKVSVLSKPVTFDGLEYVVLRTNIRRDVRRAG